MLTRTPGNQTAVASGTAGTPAPSATAIGPQGDSGTFFRLASDWGSAYPGQQINYTLVVRNTQPVSATGANDLRQLNLVSSLPNNLEVLGARADRGGNPVVSGQVVSYSLALLPPGQGVELTIATRIKAGVAAGTLLVTQGQLRYEGLTQPIFSNIVTVQVVGTLQPTSITTPTATLGAYPPPAGSATPAPTAGGTATTVVTTGPTTGRTATSVASSAPTSSGSARPTLTPTAVPVSEPQPPTPLPETNTGVPILGILLFGMTMLTRTWRLHRARERI